MTMSRARLVRALGAAALLPAALSPVLVTTAHAAAPVSCHGQAATIVGTDGDDRLRGTSGDDVIAGLAGDDVIHGRGGDDVICGDRNSDHLYGGAGGDRLVDARGRHSVQHGGPGDDRILTRSMSSTLVGGGGNDVLISSSTKELYLRYEPGDDRIISREPVQLHLDLQRSPVGVHLDLARGVLVGKGRTTFSIAPRSRTNVQGSQYDDTLAGGRLTDSLFGAGGNDHIIGRARGDALTGGPGHNFLRGGNGRDWLADGELGQGRDVAHAGPGNDSLRFSSNDVVDGGSGDDMVHVRFKVGAIGTVDGGTGSNRLIAALFPRASGQPWKHAVVDLRTRRVVADGHVMTFRGVFHQLDVKPGSALRWTVDGTSGGDVIDSTRPAQRYPIVIHARGGADTLATGGGDDVLWGGAGKDSVRAFKGTNTCHSIESDPDGTCTVSTP
jgi:Ca2+-binding RTX toxin-like protein